jgi:hypothetical protein
MQDVKESKEPMTPTRAREMQNSRRESKNKMFIFGVVTVATSLISVVSRLGFVEGRFVWIRDVLEKMLQTGLRSIFLTALYFCASCFGQLSSVDAYLKTQVPTSKANLLANIGPDGPRSSGAKVAVFKNISESTFLTRFVCFQQPGVVIASPSTHDPDYLYTWTRDAALVLKTIIQE